MIVLETWRVQGENGDFIGGTDRRFVVGRSESIIASASYLSIIRPRLTEERRPWAGGRSYVATDPDRAGASPPTASGGRSGVNPRTLA